MTSRRCITLLVLSGALSHAAGQAALESDPFEAEPTLKSATTAEIEQRLYAWLDQQPAAANVAAVKVRYRAHSQQADGLTRAARALAAWDVPAAAIVSAAERGERPYPDASNWLMALTGFGGNTLRLYLGRALAQHSRFDDARNWLEPLDPADSLDPAAVLFYQATCYQALLERDAALEALARLLSDVERLPRRFRVLGRQMQLELQSLEPESLDFASRLMRDVERRLAQGSADPPVRTLQDEVLATLDRLIKDEEDKQNSNSSSSGGSSGSPSGQQDGSQGRGAQSNQPASDSRLMGGRGPGRVAPKSIGRASGWGSLPPKEREAAWQQLGSEFPAHYREIVEQYFRELAREPNARSVP